MKYSVDDLSEFISVDEIAGWCPAAKISGLTDDYIQNMSHRTLIKFVQIVEPSASVVVASVNEEETETLSFLKKNGWEKGPWINNWGHGGRKTCLYFKQLTKASFIKRSGRQYY